jgi:RimJ/RimL family protein N-acetyltransferase
LKKRVTRTGARSARALRHARGLARRMPHTSRTFKTRPPAHASIGAPLSSASRRAMPSIHRLVTPQLELLRAVRGDAWELWELWRHPTVREPLFGLSSMPVETAVTLLDACLWRHAGLWVVRSRHTSRLIGAVSLCGWPQMAHNASALRPHAARGEFSIALLPAARGHGLGVQAAQAVLAHAFDRLRLLTMSAACRADDTRALRLLERLGFRAYVERNGHDEQRIDHLLSKAALRPSQADETHPPADFESTVPLRLV